MVFTRSRVVERSPEALFKRHEQYDRPPGGDRVENDRFDRERPGNQVGGHDTRSIAFGSWLP